MKGKKIKEEDSLFKCKECGEDKQMFYGAFALAFFATAINVFSWITWQSIDRDIESVKKEVKICKQEVSDIQTGTIEGWKRVGIYVKKKVRKDEKTNH